jgi:hypothetical protein
VNLIINGSQFINDWGGKANIYDWLGGRVNEKSSSRNRLEELVDSMVPNEDIMCRAPEQRCTVQLDGKGSNNLTQSLICNGVRMV